MKAVNTKLERNILNLQEGDLPWGNPKFYSKDISVAIPPIEWKIDNEPDEDLDPEVSATRLKEADGEILEGPWEFNMADWGYRPGTREHVHYNWISNPVDNPTIADLIDKVNAYLRETADFHGFIEYFVVNHEERLIFVDLGS